MMGIKNVVEYKTLVFDCDGVILDSNRVKTDAFHKSTINYGEDIADSFVEYHTNNGGISRYRKFDYFFSRILGRKPNQGELESLLTEYANCVKVGLLSCAIAEGLNELRNQTPTARWLVASGGDQVELRQIFAERGLSQLFNGGIFGAPNNKDEILSREIGNGNIQTPALFIGDSRYDHESSAKAGLDFAFITQWTEFKEWQAYSQQNKIFCIQNIKLLSN